ncbi:MAG: glycosyltransferase family 2 protein, partial [Candidatus Omnitrophica bacterium]|nr:glycosyltransferase family 2 protein [Candidatus Omnitrophota bacterium]
DCEVKTLFRKENLGPRMAVSTAVDWFFENVSQGIILEDDCLPDPTFFRFCQELLNKYRDDQRIMAISGDNFQLGRSVTEYSYYFSRFNHCWGWASWRRAWHYYDRDMKQWPSTRDSRYLYDFLSNKRVARYWGRRFETVYRGKIDTWDYQWTFACWLQGGLTIVPKVNLVTNIGFGRKSAHTRGRSLVADLKSEAVSFPLTHPPVVFRNAAADDFEEKTLFGSVPVYKKVVNKLYDLLNG